MRPRQPSHCSFLSMMMSRMDQSKPNLLAVVYDVSLCFHCWYLVVPRMVLTQRLWKEFRHLTCSAFNVHVSAPYSSTANPVALYTVRLVEIERIGFLKIGFLKQPNTLDTLTILPFTSSITSPSLDMTEPKEVNRSTISISSSSTCYCFCLLNTHSQPPLCSAIHKLLYHRPQTVSGSSVQYHIISLLRFSHPHHIQSRFCCPVSNQLSFMPKRTSTPASAQPPRHLATTALKSVLKSVGANVHLCQRPFLTLKLPDSEPPILTYVHAFMDVLHNPQQPKGHTTG